MGFQRRQQGGDPLDQGVIDDALILERLDLVLTLLPLEVDLVLFRADERALVDVGVDFDVGVVAQLEGVLGARYVSKREDIMG